MRLLTAARVLLARGEAKFSIAVVCEEAGVTRAQFRAQFAGKAALLAAAIGGESPVQPQAVEAKETPPDSAASSPDAWLERRLRVFERALGALEARSESMAQEQTRAIAHLEDQIARMGQRRGEQRPAVQVPSAVFAAPLAEHVPEDSAPEPAPAPQRLSQPVVTLSRAEMADVLQAARGKVRAPAQDEAKDPNARLRWLAIAGLSLVALFLCVGLSLGRADEGVRAAALAGAGVSHRHVGTTALERTRALADFGDADAQARLAIAYLKGEGVTANTATAARWGQSAAQSGQPVGQMMLGTLYGQGAGVKPDATRAFGLFAAAATRGNLKAMHNLAIAYAQGSGTDKDEAKAAQWFTRAAEHGYVDSAFDLAVLYERGIGVPQDLKQALKWYDVASLAGDAPSKARMDVLRGQLKPADTKLAMNAAMTFTPLAALPQANVLRDF